MKSDLTNDELDRLDELLAATPEPLEPLDVVMLDGYLCGVIVQPRLVGIDEWLPGVFDVEGRTLPADADTAWLAETRALLERRHDALNRALAEDGAFDPLLHEQLELPEEGDPALRDALREMPAHSHTLMPWVGGFQHAAITFPDLMDLPDDAVQTALARLFRHLPPETDEERELLATLEKEAPLKDADEAIEDMVMTVAELWDLTQDRRYAVQTIRREAPKVGRNDPCPCGSGKKYKACHGKI